MALAAQKPHVKEHFYDRAVPFLLLFTLMLLANSNQEAYDTVQKFIVGDQYENYYCR